MTLLIRNVKIIGGAQDFPERSDVFVSGDRISAIGDFKAKKADEVIDGQGAYLAPGFIDVNTDSDHYLTLFDHPGQEDFIKQGVTTIFGGMCGASLAPLLYGTLEAIQKWTDTDKINVNWHTVAEFLAVLDKRPLAVNFGTLAGHATIRRAIVGDALRDLTKNELAVFIGTLKGALNEGAFGLSSGLGYVHARKTSYGELKALAEVVKEYDGIYATHLRRMDEGVVDSVVETLKLAKETGVKTLISHFIPFSHAKAQYEKALALIDAAPADTNIRFDIYPSESVLVPLYTFLPEWVQTGGIAVMRANVADEWLAPKIQKDIPQLDENNFFVAQAPGNDSLVRKSLKEIREMYGLRTTQEALLRLMKAMNLRGTILYKDLDTKLTHKALGDKKSFVASNAPSFDNAPGSETQVKSERTTTTFTKFLSLVAGYHLMPLEEAIRKITRDPAQAFGLAGRGEIKAGNYADLVCFRGSDITLTVVNGVVAQKNGEIRKVFAGKALRHPRTK